MSLYLDVLLESAWKASLVPMPMEATLYAMKSFGGFNMPLAVFLAVAGAVAAQAVNWLIGDWLRKTRGSDGWNLPSRIYEKAERIFRKYAVWLLLFSWAVGGNILVVVAGFLGARPKMVFPLVITGYAVHYGLLLV